MFCRRECSRSSDQGTNPAACRSVAICGDSGLSKRVTSLKRGLVDPSKKKVMTSTLIDDLAGRKAQPSSGSGEICKLKTGSSEFVVDE